MHRCDIVRVSDMEARCVYLLLIGDVNFNRSVKLLSSFSTDSYYFLLLYLIILYGWIACNDVTFYSLSNSLTIELASIPVRMLSEDRTHQ